MPWEASGLTTLLDKEQVPFAEGGGERRRVGRAIHQGCFQGGGTSNQSATRHFASLHHCLRLEDEGKKAIRGSEGPLTKLQKSKREFQVLIKAGRLD